MPSWVVSIDVVPQPVIRRATVHDLPRLVDLLQQESLGDERREDPGPPLPQAYFDAFAEIDASPHIFLTVAEYEGFVVGMLQFTVIQYLQRQGARIAEVESVVVDEPWRGHGIGAALMRWAIDEARRRGCVRLQLTSNKARRDAHRFYKRLGFVASHEGMKLTL